ncbi:MAG TPA: double zinc ribbon domain-containing protein, partial [Caldilineaceae bacterium]|nr:double zinc ribbon domain-containing protein [Caldilineaceae bacterium]
MATSVVKQLALHWESVRTGAVDVVFPPRCVGSQRAGLWLCPPCAQKVEPVGERICLRCGQRQSASTPLCLLCEEQERPFSIARAATIHQGPIREGLHQLKYGGKRRLAPGFAPYLGGGFLVDPLPR